ncbi:outer membrane beta-barrel protein [Bradyrhizobium betae]|uniref:Porin family protein n=1 Tax=Bradyrhizobium betae TaxID=244734 RepID=A0A5P6P5B6_9BRAD|nr:outer membrane beta-barrel protein [Bradyrhizobium betae]MCS3728720.1 opacity protein-like surface antigen [Bradyrhizobium betae]QFI72633.1 porin family protein [Bradyrhizobium betae]
MRSVKSLLAAGAASLISSMAFAADMPIAAPPPMYAPVAQPADFGGWYLRGDIGFSNQSVKSVRKSDETAYSQMSSFNQTTGFDTAGIFGVGVGYRVNNWFRTDVTAQYRGKSNFKGSDVFNASAYGLGYSGVNNYNASKSELLFLANAYVDLGTWWCVTPFIGAGVGASQVNISNFTDSGSVTDRITAGPTHNGPSASYATAASGSKWNFAWAAHAGLAYKVNPSLTLELAYSYVDLGSGTTGAIVAYDGTTYGNTMKFKDITSHDLKLGVRWDLNSPPAYMPPPLVTKG